MVILVMGLFITMDNVAAQNSMPWGYKSNPAHIGETGIVDEFQGFNGTCSLSIALQGFKQTGNTVNIQVQIEVFEKSDVNTVCLTDDLFEYYIGETKIEENYFNIISYGYKYISGELNINKDMYNMLMLRVNQSKTDYILWFSLDNNHNNLIDFDTIINKYRQSNEVA